MSGERDQALDKIVERVQKILALGRRGGTEAEAAAAMAKAQELLAQHNLDLATVEKGPATREKLVRDTGMYIYQRNLWKSVAQLNFCLAWREPVRERVRNKLAWRNKILLVGRKVNTRATVAMAGYLEQTINRLCSERLATHTYYGGRDGSSQQTFFSGWAVSFREGIADRVIEKIEDRRGKALSDERKKERQTRRAKADGASSQTAVSLLVYKDRETDANLDFVHGAGYSARRAAQRAEAAAEKAQDEKDYAEWAAANPAAADKNYRRWWRERGYTFGGGGTAARDRSRDYGAYRAGREAGDGVGIDPQADSTRQRRIGRG